MEEQEVENIVDELLLDLADRGGLGDEWDMIDEDIQQEIRDRWLEIIMDGL